MISGIQIHAIARQMLGMAPRPSPMRPMTITEAPHENQTLTGFRG
jgi:hypothetical protein